jgi:putative hydrolase of the HAD superfamily
LFISSSGDISLTNQNSPKMEQIEFLLTKYGLLKSPRELLDEFQGAINARHNALRSQGIDFPEVKIDRIWQEVLPAEDPKTVRQFALEFELITNPIYPMPNLARLLSACRQQGLVMGIVSNAQFYTPAMFKWFLNADLQDLGFDPDLIFFSYRFEIAKPSPVLFEMAAEKLNEKEIAPSSVLYLGNDMLNDICPAKIAGFQTALFAGDRRSLRLRGEHACCKNLKADLVVTDLGQLIQLICS